MIPVFPQFKKLEFSDKKDIEAITSKYPPYSDFNFISMWSWDIKGEMRISQLHGNLIVRFNDYLTGEPFYSFLGDTDVNGTAQALLDLSKEEGLPVRLKLIPEYAIEKFDAARFEVKENQDHFDYILDNESLAAYKGHDLRGHASFSRRFLEAYGTELEVRVLNVQDVEHRQHIIELNELWMRNKVSQKKELFADLDLENEAIKKFLSAAKEHSNLLLIGLFYQGNMIAFSINEIMDNNFSCCHFMKADNTLKGIYSYLFSECGKVLAQHARKYLNIEQDLGLSNLRQSKKSFQPIHFLKKYEVTHR